LLLQINAIKLNPRNPFTWASGWKSPIYCDNRLILSFPAIRNFVRDEFAKNIEKQFGKPDVIAGVATGAIGIGILVAESMGLPFVYVRPEPKKHGRQNQVEGFLEKGQNVVIVEDLISTGNSSLLAVDALKEAGANIKGMAAIFTYGFDLAEENFKNANIELYTLSNYSNLLNLAVAKSYIAEEEQKTLSEWNVSPSTWNV
jgi:orotate phosphoribosyltransferase